MNKGNVNLQPESLLDEEQAAARTADARSGCAATQRVPARLPGLEQHTLTSSKGRTYRIYTFIPAEPPPDKGYPILYLLDANSVIGTAVEAVRMQSRKPHGFGPVAVVGIGYETDSPMDPARFYDFTRPADPSKLPARPDGSDWPPNGGAEAFIQFIEAELKPHIERELPVDRGRQTLFGHSLGGLFVVDTLFTRTAAFQTYIAGSPSIWWNEHELVQHVEDWERGFQGERPQLDASLLLAVGGAEKPHMIVDARMLAERLYRLKPKGMRFRFDYLEEEAHVSILPGLISRGLNFSLRV
ncbi:hypothetical protein SAMN02799630_01675 [Paenibacillus sp. UNCCL117]|uniref:alpha/beta hydrolase n=1 Tax=unclassified Paenibacillus TaxID=185978 RepID=UPI00088D98C0|nr:MULTISPECIES: alpha/beta hydrolase-fold protein [unclassified Paenibacillus]SDC90407.1 hypothetical protein SAMN04488602_104160 [Paenibacillus sp. cl123]SFW28827.1 hypothetical protein SAMN02799630_01675 [Paenibacillus sp. UNCCL117]